uniref:NADH-ubiquinone oxidoreductase chain 6 n=1 Tax=Digitonthophagus gazella TaxID=206854 RepID=A0A1X9HF88_9SCAR|nr:NADH deshydrogenase subunit 6 [Digitonthophagus gazella]
MLTMMMISMMMSLFMIWLKHPLTLGMILLIQTINTSLFMGYFNSNYWFSYILFLIMIGGMLVLFIYMTSIASNEKFSPSIKLFLFSMLMYFIYLITMISIDPFYMTMSNSYKMSLLNEINWSLNKYLNFPNNMIMYMLIIYLLITLLAIVKITNFKSGPLRSSN